MLSLLHSQLENERTIYTKLLKENRKDLIAQMLLARIEKEIQTLEGKINGIAERKENIKRGHRYRFIQFIRETMHRGRDIQNSSNSPIHSIPAIAIT